MMINPIYALADAIWHGFEQKADGYISRSYDTIDSSFFNMDEIAAAALEQFRKNSMIKTVEELNELPPGSVIRVPGGTVLERVGIEDFVEWWADGDVQPIVDDDLPALLLYLPPRG